MVRSATTTTNSTTIILTTNITISTTATSKLEGNASHAHTNRNWQQLPATRSKAAGLRVQLYGK